MNSGDLDEIGRGGGNKRVDTMRAEKGKLFVPALAAGSNRECTKRSTPSAFSVEFPK